MTKIADVIVPEIFNDYVIEQTAEKSELIQCGIVETNPELDKLASSGGKTINMPYWSDLAGSDEVLSDTTPLTPAKITANQDVAVLLMRGKSWSANDLAKALSGDDPMRAIAELVGSYWARRIQVTLFSLLQGAFGPANMSGNVHDISGEAGAAAVITASNFIDAVQNMGDAKSALSGVAMHSAVVSKLAKDDLIDFKKNSEGTVDMKYFMGKRVIEDDTCPISGDVYTSYIFGNGAIGYGNGAPPVPTEDDRDSLQGEDILITRKHFILHPRGVAWQAQSIADSSPTNGELEAANQWSRVYESKNIRMVQFKHKITA